MCGTLLLPCNRYRGETLVFVGGAQSCDPHRACLVFSDTGQRAN